MQVNRDSFLFSSAHGGVGFAGVGFEVVGLVVMVSHSCRRGCECRNLGARERVRSESKDGSTERMI